jgi:hypothetical protein
MSLNLDAIVEGSSEPSNEDKNKVKQEENKFFGAELRRFEETTDLRSLLAKVFTVIITFWLVGVFLILVGNNFNYRLSDSVLKTLLTTTTIQVLGMMVIILWDLFPGGKDKNNNADK